MGLQQFSGKTVKELGLVVKDYRQRSRGIVGDVPTDETHSPRELRWARTTTDTAINGLYPSAPATKFVVEFGELTFDDSDVGNETAVFTPYDPREVRVAFSPSGWLEENSVVRITWHHGRWYILYPEGTIGLAEAMLAADMCPTDADTEQTVTVDAAKYLPDCNSFTPTKVTNPFHHRGPDNAKVLMVRKKCPDTAEEWMVIDVEKTRYCAVIGIDDRPSCLVAAGLQLAGEWCPSDEPTAACKIVDYTDCATTLDACDTTWTFDPLYACC